MYVLEAMSERQLGSCTGLAASVSSVMTLCMYVCVTASIVKRFFDDFVHVCICDCMYREAVLRRHVASSSCAQGRTERKTCDKLR